MTCDVTTKTAQEWIEEAKASETVEQLTPLRFDEDLQVLLSVWPTIGNAEIDPEASFESWPALWRGRRFQNAVFPSVRRFDRTLQKAIAFKRIYPDGTIHARATAFLRSQLAKTLPRKNILIRKRPPPTA